MVVGEPSPQNLGELPKRWQNPYFLQTWCLDLRSVTNAKILSRFSWTPPQSCQGGWGWLDRVHTPWGTIILMWVGILNEIWVIVNPMHFQWRNRTGQHSVIVTILNPKFFRLIYAQIDLYISLWFVVSKEWWCCVVSYPDLDHPHFIGWTGVR